MTAALIVACAGQGAPEAPVENDIPAVQRQVLALQLGGVRRVAVAAASAQLPALQRDLAHMGVVFLQAAQPTACLQTGLAYLHGRARVVLVAPAGGALFSAQTVEALLAAEPARPLLPEHRGRTGWPLLLPAACLPAVLESGAQRVEDILPACGADAARLPVEDGGTQAPARLRPLAKVYLAADKPFFGPGPQLLLALVDETGVLREACRLMGISYSKGLKMMDEAERQLGFALVQRARGGAGRGHTALTQEGRALLRRYARFQAEAQRRVAQAYAEIFGPGAPDA